MSKTKKASLWLGNIGSEERFWEYIKVDYDWDSGDEDDTTLHGEFIEDFGITRDCERFPDFDPYDNIEARFLYEGSDSLAELLAGLSFYRTVIPACVESFGAVLDKSCNLAILAYDYAYDPSAKPCSKPRADCEFIGVVEFELYDPLS